MPGDLGGDAFDLIVDLGGVCKFDLGGLLGGVYTLAGLLVVGPGAWEGCAATLCLDFSISSHKLYLLKPF